MNGEILKVETLQQLANRKKTIKYCKDILKLDTPTLVKVYVNEILNVLEGKA
jgi:hypothetical protein